ncbi:coiled-coil domain-containing protein 87 [Suncus etruscus]|uniref:coiled-coil domain-containing protein 87 n=1 Tax=Suncus etruscus TaxID=109475 RepID=UPI0021108639|nr:coiled-coil domain-containing protein 87 [Suncus etruscus]
MEPSKPESELQQFYHRMLLPLTLFPGRKPPAESEEPRPQGPSLLPWPVSRLTPEALCRQVAKRLAHIGLTVPVPAEARSRLTRVILDELQCAWQEPRPEPGLSRVEHQRLRERLHAHVLLSSELLFLRYLNLLAAPPSAPAVFTASAQLVRLAASLARDCTRVLTGHEVYRRLLADFQSYLQLERYRGGPRGALRLHQTPPPASLSAAPAPFSTLSLNSLIQLSRPVPAGPREPEQDPLQELKSIPQLKKRHPLRWLPSLPKKEGPVGSVKTDSQPPVSSIRVSSPKASPPASPPRNLLVQKALSMPSLREGKKLADILGLPPLPSRPLSPSILLAESKPELAAGAVADDLKQLVKNLKSEPTHSPTLPSSLHPLVAALTKCQVGASRLKGLQEKLQELEDADTAPERFGLPTPKDHQGLSHPVTFTVKLNGVFVRGAARQISERSLETTYHVEGARLLYNHLSGELESKLIDKIDVDHFLGISIGEVYKELMNCVSLKYFSLEPEPLIVPALETKGSGMLASSYLFPGKQYSAINPKLVGIAPYKGDPSQLNAEKMASFSSLQDVKGWDKSVKKFSWLNWWKSTVSVEDYFRYLNKEDTDFLHVIFHLYQEEGPEAPPVKDTYKIQHPPPLLQDEELDFVPGEWNWSSLTEYSERMKRVTLLEKPHKLLDLQKRLEQLWNMLEVPEKEQLDMAIKYSSNTHLRQLPSLVKAWEQALEHIKQRELLLGKLEWFERQASNPNRLFQSGLSPNHLLEENQVRNQLYKNLRRVDRPLTTLLEDIKTLFGEPVTFKGRSYLEKMQHDRVEMLYWLQQRRRIRHLLQLQKTKQGLKEHQELRSQQLTE